jgi:ABC-2 type transport system permease protein
MSKEDRGRTNGRESGLAEGQAAGDPEKTACAGRRSQPPRGLRSYASFLFEYLKANLAMQMEYRATFIGRIIGMVLNDAMWLSFWLIYFARFPVVRGWERADVVTLWAVCALGFGLCFSLFGNINRIASIVVRGDLDFYLVYPRHVLLHLAVSRMDATALGDVAFGLVVFFALVKPTVIQALLFVVSGLLVACIFFGFTVIIHSLAFVAGNSEMLADQASNTLIHFATYPSSIFDGPTKAILFTLVPAGFINTIPVSVIRDFDPLFFAGLALAAIFLLPASDRIFKALRRKYESGNLMQVRM